MKYIKEYNQFILEEENIVKKLLLSTILSLGLTYADAQVIQQDTSKIDVVNSIFSYLFIYTSKF